KEGNPVDRGEEGSKAGSRATPSSRRSNRAPQPSTAMLRDEAQKSHEEVSAVLEAGLETVDTPTKAQQRAEQLKISWEEHRGASLSLVERLTAMGSLEEATQETDERKDLASQVRLELAKLAQIKESLGGSVLALSMSQATSSSPPAPSEIERLRLFRAYKEKEAEDMVQSQIDSLELQARELKIRRESESKIELERLGVQKKALEREKSKSVTLAALNATSEVGEDLGLPVESKSNIMSRYQPVSQPLNSPHSPLNRRRPNMDGDPMVGSPSPAPKGRVPDGPGTTPADSFHLDATTSLPPLHGNSMIPDTTDEVAQPCMVQAQAHLSHLSHNFHNLDTKAEVLILLGRNGGDLLRSTQYGDKAPLAYDTALGWALVGSICSRTLRKDQYVDRALRTALSQDHWRSPVSTFPGGSGDESGVWDVQAKDNRVIMSNVFRRFPDDEEPGLSLEDKRFLEIAEASLHVNNDGFLTIKLPFKIEEPRLPNNREPVLRRSLGTLRRPPFLRQSTLVIPGIEPPSETDQLPEFEEANPRVLKVAASPLGGRFDQLFLAHGWWDIVAWRVSRIIWKLCRFRSTITAKRAITLETLSPMQAQDWDILALVRDAQAACFSLELSCLASGKTLPQGHRFVPLAPFQDNEGVLSVGGRLRWSEFPYDYRHPILIPRKHPITQSILEHCHRKINHQGRHVTAGAVRESGFHVEGSAKEIRQLIA
ncbi:hypothetical protein TCAL_13940, partial [Tigriopus californicus]